YPFAETRSVLDIRIGILTLREKWELLFRESMNSSSSSPIIFSSNTIPTIELANQINSEKFSAGNQSTSIKKIEYPWDIFELNDFCIREDYELVCKRRISEVIPETVQVVRSTRIFLEEGANISHCVLNAETGPIYIGKNAKVM